MCLNKRFPRVSDNGRGGGGEYIGGGGGGAYRYGPPEDAHRLPPVAQKKHQMFGKRFFQENTQGRSRWLDALIWDRFLGYLSKTFGRRVDGGTFVLRVCRSFLNGTKNFPRFWRDPWT